MFMTKNATVTMQTPLRCRSIRDIPYENCRDIRTIGTTSCCCAPRRGASLYRKMGSGQAGSISPHGGVKRRPTLLTLHCKVPAASSGHWRPPTLQTAATKALYAWSRCSGIHASNNIIDAMPLLAPRKLSRGTLAADGLKAA